ncbi:MAG: glycosyltransferase family 2 protein [Pseudomonadota bacterium]
MSVLQPHQRLAQGRRDAEETQVTILLATHNGAAFLVEQLNSLTNQTHTNWSLLVSDDASTDHTREIVRQFAETWPDRRVTLLRGPGRGSAQNFLSLLRASGGADYVAFCDQDDVWLPDKLTRAVGMLQGCVAPALYGSRTIIADRMLTPIRFSKGLSRAPGFSNALVQNVTGGNTMVLNRAALDVLQPASLFARRIIAHDWWCYQMVTGCDGHCVIDAQPTLYYRQHCGNQHGANTGFFAALSRARGLINGRYSTGLTGHLEALASSAEWLSPEARATLADVRSARGDRCIARVLRGLRTDVHRQSARETVALRIALALGRA